ncbi:hypothetical protein Pint_11996 [Pistacia integerrima]|uniref:Uncharacterized protein n=1 Tax=Pistacia integerrima TaxID=434235 RepID=A0ACC0XLS9_9ROSI|nr:hypothetical protein Pint_11996 [Pistacia integerrima]
MLLNPSLFLISPFHSGSESYSELNPTEPQVKFPSEEVRMKLSAQGWINSAPVYSRHHVASPKKFHHSLAQGTSSIWNFFKSQNPSCSSWKQEDVETSQNAKATVGDCCSKLIQVQEPIESFLPETATNSGRSSSDQIQQTSEAWNYRIEEIDPTVIDELPP